MLFFLFQLLLRTIKRCVPSLFRFLACALVLYFAFVFPAWVILGPFNMKFRSFISTLECLFSLINGDDMYVTFSIIDRSKGIGIFIFSRIFLYIFITLFIYAVLNIFVTIIFEAYEEVKVCSWFSVYVPNNIPIQYVDYGLHYRVREESWNFGHILSLDFIIYF